jgi:hypothetical protein
MRVAGVVSGRVPGCGFRGFAGRFRDAGGKRPSAGDGGPAMTVKITVTEIGDDGAEVPLDAELAAALAGAASW